MIYSPYTARFFSILLVWLLVFMPVAEPVHVLAQEIEEGNTSSAGQETPPSSNENDTSLEGSSDTSLEDSSGSGNSTGTGSQAAEEESTPNNSGNSDSSLESETGTESEAQGESNNTSETSGDATLEGGSFEDESSNAPSSPHPTSSWDEDDPVIIVETGNVSGTQNVNTTANNNQIDTSIESGCTSCAGGTVVNEQTGENSENQGAVSVDESLVVDNKNNAAVDTTLEQNGNTGTNDIQKNLANIGLSTGDIQLISALFNLINFNVVGTNYLAEAYSVAGEVIGDLDLSQFTLNDLATHVRDSDDWKNFLVANLATGEGSTNVGAVNTNTSTTINNTNDAEVNNKVTLTGISGNNTVVENGNVLIKTGDVVLANNLVNIVNTSIVGENWTMVMVNIVGRWVGDLLLPSLTNTIQQTAPSGSVCNGNCGTDVELLNNSTGEESINVADANQNNSQTIGVANNAEVNTNVEVLGTSGDNQANGNEGSVYVETGEVVTMNQILDYVNTNIIKDNWVYGVVNVSGGNWSGEIWGVPSEGFRVSQRGAQIVFSYTPSGLTASGDPSAIALKNQGTGNNSTNTAIANQNGATVLNNNNTAVVNNDVTIVGNSGGNVANDNNGTVYIETGDVFALSNIFNLVNSTIVGDHWTFALINIMGSWEGGIHFGQPDLNVFEIVEPDPNPAVPGGMLYYTLTVTNQGDAPATDILLSAHINPSLVEVVDTGGGEHEGRYVYWEIPYLGVGEMAVRHYQARVRSDVEGAQAIFNNASVYSAVPDRNERDNFAETVVIVEGNGNAVESESGNNNTSADSTIENYVVGKNKGPIIGGNFGVPVAANNPTQEVKKAVKQQPVLSGTIDTQVYDSAQTSEQLQIHMSNDSDGILKRGETVNFKLVVTNTENKALDDVYIFDSLYGPDGEVVSEKYWKLGEVFPYEEITITYSVTFSENSPFGEYKNTSWADGFTKAGQYLVFEGGGNTISIEEEIVVDQKPKANIKFSYEEHKTLFDTYTEQVTISNKGKIDIPEGLLVVQYDKHVFQFTGGVKGVLEIPVPGLKAGEKRIVDLQSKAVSVSDRTQIALGYIVQDILLSSMTTFEDVVTAEDVKDGVVQSTSSAASSGNDSQQSLGDVSESDNPNSQLRVPQLKESYSITIGDPEESGSDLDESLQPRVLGASKAFIKRNDGLASESTAISKILDFFSSIISWVLLVALVIAITVWQRQRKQKNVVSNV